MTPRYQLVVDVIPISEAPLRALTAGYRYNQRMREAMADQAARLRDAQEMAMAKTFQEGVYAQNKNVSAREVAAFVNRFNGRS